MWQTSRRSFLKVLGVFFPSLLESTRALGAPVSPWNAVAAHEGHASWNASNYSIQPNLAPIPVTVLKRPFSVEPHTGVMMMDGIFDASLQFQIITCFVTNESANELSDVSVYLEGVGDIGVVVNKQTIVLPRIPAGASMRVGWRADFSNATPGKPLVTIRAFAKGFSTTRVFKNIFVSKTRYDAAAKAYVCSVPEGTLTLQINKMIGPKRLAGSEVGPSGPWLLTDVTTTVVTPFSGQEGPLAFEDPLWKVVFGIIAVLAFLGAVLSSDGEADNSSKVNCDTDPATGDKTCSGPISTSAMLFTVAGAAAKACFADRRDPWVRGREATKVSSTEKTLAETVNGTFVYPTDITPGEAYGIDVEWLYRGI